MKLIRIVLIPILLLSLQGCLTYACYDWSDRRESLKAVTGAYNGTAGYLFRYSTEILSQDDEVVESIEQFALLTETDLQQNTLTTTSPSDMPGFITSQPELYTFMFYPVTMRTIGAGQAEKLMQAMRAMKTDKESATGYAPGFYNVKRRYFLVTTADSGLPRVFKTAGIQLHASSGDEDTVISSSGCRRYCYIASATRNIHHGGKQQPDDVTIAQRITPRNLWT